MRTMMRHCPPKPIGVPSVLRCWQAADMGNRELRLSRIAETQYGAFTCAQAAACGFGVRTIEDRASRGAYVRLHPGVYAIGGAPRTWLLDVSAAVLSVNDNAAASHQTAAVLWGMTDRRPERIDVITDRWDRVRRPGIAVHESRDLLRQDRVRLEGIALTSPVRTIVDLGAEARPWLVESCLDAALRAELFDLQDVRRLIARVGRRGRRGVGTIRPLVEERLKWQGLTESELEDKFRRLIEFSRLPQPIPQFQVRDGSGRFVCRADFAYPEQRLLIELDSEAFHMDRDTFQRDRAKQNRTLALGWTTVRFTWYDLTKHPDQVVGLLADICAA